MEGYDLTKYREIFLRRKYWTIIPFLLTLLAGLTYTLKTPPIYQAETLVVVIPQRVPREYVQQIVSTGLEDRLRTITQQVTSRTNLESIIHEYQLFKEPSAHSMVMENKVESLRKRIEINIPRGERGGNSFTIVFRDKDPEKTMRVTNALASNFITENLKTRESQALGTSSFLADELESIKRKLIKKEELIKQYREKYMGAMPEHLQTNLSMLERLQGQLEQLHSNLRDAQNRKLILQQQIADAKRMGGRIAIGPPASQGRVDTREGASEEPQDLTSLKRELAQLKLRYSEKHPDVKHLEKMIRKAESEEAESGSPAEGRGPSEAQAADTSSAGTRPVPTAVGTLLEAQLQQLDFDITNTRVEIKKAQARTAVYQQRVDDTPKREEEFISLKRDYDNLRELYNSVLNRKLEAEMAVSMEKKQKGEQFRVIDPAKVPERPVEPDVGRIALFALLIGLGLGCGLAYMVEMMDTSYKDPQEVEKELQLPVLVSLPIRYSQKELNNQKVKGIIVASSVAVGFIFAAIVIVFAVKGVDTTLDYIKNFLEKI